MKIRDTVDRLCKKYKTRNPYELIEALGIILTYGEGMEEVRGFYLYDSRIRLICVGNNLPDYLERFVAAHELGHAIMHKHSCAPFLRNTLWSVDKLELQANKFAAELLIPDQAFLETPDYTVDQWAAYYGLPREIIELRLR